VKLEEEKRKDQESNSTVAEMLHTISGRDAFIQSKPRTNASDLVDVSTLKAMLIRENELRLCPETQREYAKRQADYMTFTDELQARVAREFGFEPDIGVDILRCALQLYPNHTELAEIPLYVKYNRSRQGCLAEGDAVPDVPLLTLDGEEITIRNYVRSIPGSESVPLVLISGSYT
jgi:hypothetical protein